MVVIGGTALTGRPRHDHRHRPRRPDPAAHAKRDRADRRAGACLQHLHRRDHPWHDGAALRAREAPQRGDLRWRPRHASRRDAQHREVLRPHPCAAEREPDDQAGRDRGASGRQRRRASRRSSRCCPARFPTRRGRSSSTGRRSRCRSTNDAIAAGIETIYQDFALVPQLSIARNLFLGRELRTGPWFLDKLDNDRMNEVARDLLKRVGISKNIPPTTPIGSLSGGERQAVAIARAMYFDSDLIILDEPTNNLGVAETQGRAALRARGAGHGAFLHLHRPQHPPRLPGRGPHGGDAAGTVAADDLSPKTSSIQDVEDIITGEHIAA